MRALAAWRLSSWRSRSRASPRADDTTPKWNVWVGKRLAGRVLWHSPGRWDLVRLIGTDVWGSKLGPVGPIGYAVGADPVGVGVAFILLGRC